MPSNTVPCPPVPQATMRQHDGQQRQIAQHLGDDAAFVVQEQVEHQQRERAADQHQLRQQRHQVGGGG